MWLAVDGKIKYRAIVSDLDGTLLDPSGNLSDVTVETLNILQRRGWKSSLQRALRRGCARDRGWAGVLAGDRFLQRRDGQHRRAGGGG